MGEISLSSEIKKLQVQASLAEYQALRTELLQKFKHQLQIYSILIPAMGLLIGYSIKEGAYDLLLILPVIATTFAFRYIWEQNVIATLSTYLYQMENKTFPRLIGELETGVTLSTLENTPFIGWERYFREKFKTWPIYKFTTQLIFIVIPFCPSLVFSSMMLYQTTAKNDSHIVTVLPMWGHLLSVLVYGALAFFLSRYAWKELEI